MDNSTEKKSWFERLFSLDEMKTSSLVLSLFACLGFGIFLCLDKGDIPPNLAMVILALIGAIGGVSAFNLMSNRNNNQYQNMNYQNTQYPPTSTFGNVSNLINSPVPNSPIEQITINNQMENESDPSARGI